MNDDERDLVELENETLKDRLSALEQRVSMLEAKRNAPDAAVENAVCLDCGSQMQHVRPGKWQCDACDARRWMGAPMVDDDSLGED